MSSRIEILVVSGLSAVSGFLANLYIILCLILPKNEEGRERANHAVNLTVGAASFLHMFSCAGSLLMFSSISTGRPPDRTTATIILYIWNGSIFSTISAMALLFILYWGKIVPVRGAVLVRWLAKLTEGVHWVVVCLVLVCFSTSTFIFGLEFSYENTTDALVNEPKFGSMDLGDYFMMSVNVLLMVLLPFGLMVFTSLSILLHLGRHVQRLRSDACDIAHPQMDQEIRAMRMLLCQMLLYSVFVSLYLSLIMLAILNYSSTLQGWTITIECLYCFCTALNLICRNGYLRKRTASLFFMLKGKG